MDFLKEVEDYKEFLTVDELNKEIFKICDKKEVTILGKSDGGADILCVKLGNGKENALIYGFPHPNEPIGSLTCLTLIKLIKKHKEFAQSFTWHIISCADPDGAKLNEGWFKGDFTVKKYVYNFYRTQPKKQTDWSFPIKYKAYSFDKPPKNTEVLAKLIRELKPSLVYPLHNAGFSGAYFYVTKDLGKGYYDKTIKLCKDLKIPLDLGEPESPFMKTVKKPVYTHYGLREIYDHFKKNGQDPLKELDHGTNGIDYAKTYNKNVFGLIGEVSYIYDSKIEDNNLSKESREDILRIQYNEYSDIMSSVDEVLNLPDINKRSIFYELLNEVIKLERSLVRAAIEDLKDKSYKRKATNSEKFSSEVISKFYAALILGECRRLLLDSRKTKGIEDAIGKVERKINLLIEYIDKNSNYNLFPIKTLVQLQIGCLILSLKSLEERK